MAETKRKVNRGFTWRDFLSWPDDERWEILDGEAIQGSAAPSRSHSLVMTNLAGILIDFFRDRPCEVHVGQLAVRFPRAKQRDEEIEDVVIPDLVVVCDAEKLDHDGCRGGPDLIVEVISPGTATIDNITKKNLYERGGVGEYWLVHPIDRLVTVYRQASPDVFAPAVILGDDAQVRPGRFPELTVDFSSVFPPKPMVVREPPRPFSGD